MQLRAVSIVVLLINELYKKEKRNPNTKAEINKHKTRRCQLQRTLPLFLTWEADCLLDEDPDEAPAACMAEVCLRYSTSLKTFLSPPPALCFTLSRDPTLLSTFTSTFSLRI